MKVSFKLNFYTVDWGTLKQMGGYKIKQYAWYSMADFLSKT